MASRAELLKGADQVAIEYEHWKVHDGQVFNFSFANSLAGAAVQDILIVVGAKQPHIKIAVSAEAALKVQFYESAVVATTTSYGTTISAYNMTRDATNTPTTAFFLCAAATIAASTLLDTVIIGTTGTPTTRVGGEAAHKVEWELKTSTLYAIRMTNLASGTQTAAVSARFYEEA
jgi:hypothetical protein